MIKIENYEVINQDKIQKALFGLKQFSIAAGDQGRLARSRKR